jgi:hypothetical protein
VRAVDLRKGRVNKRNEPEVERVVIVICGRTVLVAACEEELLVTTGSGLATGKTSLKIGKAKRRKEKIEQCTSTNFSLFC